MENAKGFVLSTGYPARILQGMHSIEVIEFLLEELGRCVLFLQTLVLCDHLLSGILF